LLDIQTNPIPARLSLDDQGAFILGYYHQRQDIYTPKNHTKSAEIEA
jgi:CRISPR-associated protein Csd1